VAGALKAGWAILKAGGPAVDAVQATVASLEDSPHFNAGHGAALTEDGRHELDASIMDGSTLAAGAVAGTSRIRNPVHAARALLDRGKALLLVGPAADRFAEEAGLVMVDPSYFTTERRVAALASLKRMAAEGSEAKASEAEKHGTVGAVARDAQGRLAAATSTGGYNNKPSGRVGDSPLIGAGTYARDGACAVSCTGMGEFFIRNVAAHDVAARIAYGGQSLEEATGALVFKILAGYGIGAGMIAVGAEGDPLAPFNTLGMHRGWIGAAGRVIVASHQEAFDMGAAA
jgi:beta-aspartyl-peptidase (threonine type)